MMSEPARRIARYDFANSFGDGRVISQLQLRPDEQRWQGKPPKQAQAVPVRLYLGCNVLKTAQLVTTVSDVFAPVSQATGQAFEAVGGPACCCGIVHHREGEPEQAARISANTLRHFAPVAPERVVMWCPSCIAFYDEFVQTAVPARVQL